MQPGTNNVAFIIAQNSGLMEIEEGELTGKQLKLQTHALARTSFAKKPQVKQISRMLELRSDGRLEHAVSMATDKQPMMQHLHVIYRRPS
ncbi:peroxynitrite isomerase THAP4-like [Limanda limanda]|uniref:peroxynitrite isomerase THAP4-like n=1 Tax=Limanda limanda TaxID=27771 RepID=UPI0029C9907D|nr:peroxynitrite isomerase THAP4-like [Limanda limanda]